MTLRYGSLMPDDKSSQTMQLSIPKIEIRVRAFPLSISHFFPSTFPRPLYIENHEFTSPVLSSYPFHSVPQACKLRTHCVASAGRHYTCFSLQEPAAWKNFSVKHLISFWHDLWYFPIGHPEEYYPRADGRRGWKAVDLCCPQTDCSCLSNP